MTTEVFKRILLFDRVQSAHRLQTASATRAQGRDVRRAGEHEVCGVPTGPTEVWIRGAREGRRDHPPRVSAANAPRACARTRRAGNPGAGGLAKRADTGQPKHR